MSDTRAEALRQALHAHAGQSAPAAAIVATAEAFYGFLTSSPVAEPSARPLVAAE